VSFREPSVLVGLLLLPLAAALRRAGADHLVLSTAGDWLRDLAGHLRRSRPAPPEVRTR